MQQSVVLQPQPTRSTLSGESQTINAYGLGLRYYYVPELLFKLRDSQTIDAYGLRVGILGVWTIVRCMLSIT
jgi:hypothetical protein